MSIDSYEDIFGTIDTYAIVEARIPEAFSGDGILRSTEQCNEWAKKIGCSVVGATDEQLFVDIDTEAQFNIFKYQIKLLKRHFWFEKDYKVTPSKQGLPHRHITIKLMSPLPLLARIALQACLGSDPTREMLSVRRALDNEENVVLFFEKKSAV